MSTYPIYLACCNCNARKPLSQLKEPLCSACLSAIIICTKCKEKKPTSAYTTVEGKEKRVRVRDICNTCVLLSMKSLSSPKFQINQDGLTTRCMKCNEEKSLGSFSCDLKDKGNNICNDCKNYSTCVQCNEEKPRQMYANEEWQKEKSIYEPCKSIAMIKKKKCVDCNTAKTIDNFSRRAWTREKRLRCKDCVQKQMKTCVDCNVKKTFNDFSQGELCKEKSMCSTCLQTKICLDCKVEKRRDEFVTREWKQKKSRCSACEQEQKKTCLDCGKEKQRSAFRNFQWRIEKSTCNSCFDKKKPCKKFSNKRWEEDKYHCSELLQMPIAESLTVDLNCPDANADTGSVANTSCMMCKRALHENKFGETEIYKPKSLRICKECNLEPLKPPSSDQGNGQPKCLVTPDPKYTSLSHDEGINKTLKADNLALSVVEIKSKVLFNTDKESRKRSRDDVDNDTEIGPAQKVPKQHACIDEADNNRTSSIRRGLSIGLEPTLVLFRSTNESMWWPALATTSIKKLINATKLDRNQKIQVLKMNIDALKRNNKQQNHDMIYVSRFLSQHHPEDQQPMQIISKDEQHDLICDFIDESFVCENEEGQRGRAVDLAILWRFENEDDTVELVERDTSVCSEDLQKRVDNHDERLKKLEEEKYERWKKSDDTRMNVMRLEEERNQYAKKTEDMRGNLMRLKEEKNECEKKVEEARENTKRLEKENNAYTIKAQQQSERIMELEEEMTSLKCKTEVQNKSIEKLKGLQDLSEGLKAELECPICLDPFDNPYMNPECGHRFCYRCIQQAISKSGKECPLCRVKITSKRGLRKDVLIGSITNVVFLDDNECIEIN